jgi:hypothetical protein
LCEAQLAAKVARFLVSLLFFSTQLAHLRV